MRDFSREFRKCWIFSLDIMSYNNEKDWYMFGNLPDARAPF